MRNAARILAALFLIPYSLFLVAVAPANAQVNPYAVPQTNPDVPQNMHTLAQSAFIEAMAAVSCQLTGIDPINPHGKCLGIDAQTGKIGFVDPSKSSGGGGAIGVTSKAISMLFTPPIHTSDYFAYLGENFGITKKAYAQGTGFTSLTPLLPLWSAFRNIVYLLFIIVFVVVGLAIMLRLKIDPRTVMSIENQLPKLIIGILLVTFSFAIAGLVVDMMYVSMYLAYNTVSSATADAGGPSDSIKSLNPAVLQGKFPLDAIGSIGGVAGLAGNVANAGKTIFQNTLGIPPVASVTDLFSSTFSLHLDRITKLDGSALLSGDFERTRREVGKIIEVRPLGTLIDGFSAIWAWITASRMASVVKFSGQLPIVGGVDFDLTAPAFLFFLPLQYIEAQLAIREVLPYAIIWLVIVIALLWAMLRLGFELLKAYIFFLLDVVLAPFWIVFGLFPGSPMGFGAWLRNIAANLSVFPVTIGMLMLGKIFMDVFANKSNSIFVPPLVGNPTGGDVSPLASLIGIGFILLTPQVLAMIKELIKAPSFKYAGAIGQAVGVGTAAINIPEHAQKLGMLGYYGGYMRHIPWLGRFLGGKQDRQA